MAAPGWATPAAWAVIAAFAILVGWIVGWHHPVGDYYTESDFYGGYAAGARAIQHGIVDPARYPVVGPGYEFALAIAGWVGAPFGADLFDVGKLLSLACGIGTLVVWFLVLRRRAGAGVALAVSALLAANPVFVRYSYSATTDLLGVFLASASVYALLGRRSAHPVMAGALAALATLTRYNLGALLPAAVIVLAWIEPPAIGRRRALLAYLGAYAAVTVPWLAWSLIAGHVPGENLYRNFGFYLNPDPSRNVQDEYGFLANAQLKEDSLLELLRHRPLELLRRSVLNVPLHLKRDAAELLGLPVAIACVAGFTGCTGAAARRALGAVWLCGALLFLGLVPVFYSDRYSMPLVPVYLVFAGLFAFSREGALGRVGWPWRAALVAAALVTVVARCVPDQAKVLALTPVETRSAGAALRAVAAPGARTISRKGHIGYYSGTTPIPFPRFRTLQELAGFARANRADFLYFSWYEALLRPEFAYLLDSTATIPGLTRIHVTTHNPSIVYRIGLDFGTDPDWIADVDARRLHDARALVQVLPDSLAWTHRLVLGAHALAEGRYADALREGELAGLGRPGEALHWTLQGEALRAMNRHDDARIAFGRALSIDAADIQARIGLGYSEVASGDTAAALAAWRPAIERTVNAQALAAMAELFERTGDTNAAAAARAALDSIER